MDLKKIIRENIDKTVHMSLATVSGNKPWVCEVHFAYDDQLNLYWRSLKSRRHSQELAVNPNVSGNIVRQFALGETPLGLYFEGTAKLLEGEADKLVAYQCIKDRLGVKDSVLQESNREDGAQFYKVTISTWYVVGSFDGKPLQKYSLAWDTDSKP